MNNQINHRVIRLRASFVLAFCVVFNAGIAGASGEKVHTDSRVKSISYDKYIFSSDPLYDFEKYDVNKQLKIYGGKAAYDFPSALIEIGGGIYDNGPIGQSSYIFGETNPVDNQVYVYGDWRTALASNDNGGLNQTRLATRLNLDVDWRITGTERLHALFQPLQDGANFTRYDISGAADSTGRLETDSDFQTLFFEGDLGNIIAGFGGTYSSQDMPFAIGLMPLLFQNGVWMDDAFTGLAFAIPHVNSKMFDISNMDITFFAGFDKANTSLTAVNTNDVSIYGLNLFIEANQGYWEVGYGYTQADTAALDGQDYHNITVAFTKRYFDKISNSIRIITNTGQSKSKIFAASGGGLNADGTLILLENSLVTSLPTTLIPYLNLFYGDGQPQSLARAAAAGGVLKNTGINFETDNLTGFPTLDASANDTAGGALGVEYLFDLHSQIVVEAAILTVHGNDPSRKAQGDQMALGIRYQIALDSAWIFRADAMVASRDAVTEKDLAGARVEIRRKF